MVILSLASLKIYFLKKIIFLLLTLAVIACSSKKEQMETIRNLAIEDIKIQLQLPEGTKFKTEDIIISGPISDVEELGEIFIVKFAIKSQDIDGNIVLKNHSLEYVKIVKGGLDPSDYELKSFD
ncbi:MAG: hypothetical protein ACI840_002288 [Ulvibacter sp.]|jgi:hypothetical protein